MACLFCPHGNVARGQNKDSTTRCLDLLCHFIPGTSLGHLPGPLSPSSKHITSLFFCLKAAVRKRWKELPHLVRRGKWESEFVYHLQFHSQGQYLYSSRLLHCLAESCGGRKGERRKNESINKEAKGKINPTGDSLSGAGVLSGSLQTHYIYRDGVSFLLALHHRFSRLFLKGV